MDLKALPNFKIKNNGAISLSFLLTGIGDFHEAADLIWSLPYGRNKNRAEYKLVLRERKGTCSTKHALLSALCIEHDVKDIKLYTGIYEMKESNTPGVGPILEKYELDAIPEAHCYLKCEGRRYDFTRRNAVGEQINHFLAEKQIDPDEIGNFKLNFHRSYLAS